MGCWSQGAAPCKQGASLSPARPLDYPVVQGSPRDVLLRGIWSRPGVKETRSSLLHRWKWVAVRLTTGLTSFKGAIGAGHGFSDSLVPAHT